MLSKSVITRKLLDLDNFCLNMLCPSLYRSKNQCGHSVANDAATIWNALPNDVHSASTFVLQGISTIICYSASVIKSIAMSRD